MTRRAGAASGAGPGFSGETRPHFGSRSSCLRLEMQLKNFLRFRGLQEVFSSINPRTIYLYSVIIGLLSGLGAIVFNELLHAAVDITMGSWVRLPIPPMLGDAPSDAISAGPPRRWLLLLLPVIGGLISGLLVKTLAPETEGTGTDSYIDAFHNKAGSMRRRVPLVKSLATIATISSGGSAGKKGPSRRLARDSDRRLADT